MDRGTLNVNEQILWQTTCYAKCSKEGRHIFNRCHKIDILLYKISELTIKNTRIIPITIVGILTIAALLLRLAFIHYTVISNPIHDARQYVTYGYNLLEHHIFSSQMPSNPKKPPQPDAFRSPGYPLLMAAAIYWGGAKGFYPTILFWQTIIGSLMVPLTFMLACRIIPFQLALGAALLVCISPHLISMTSYLLSETLFSLTLILAVLFFVEAMLRKKAIIFAVSGLSFGMAFLVNETAMLLPLALLIVFWLASKGYLKKKPFQLWPSHMVIFLAVFIIFPVGWSIRNHISLSEKAQSGYNRALNTLTHGTYPGFIYKNSAYKYFPYREDPRQPEFSSSVNALTSILWERIKKRPLRYLSWYLVEKPYYLWSWNILQGQGDVYIYPVTTSLYFSSKWANVTRIFMKVLHPFILIFAVIGFILWFKGVTTIETKTKNDLIQSILFIILIYYTLLYTLFASWPRYSVPLRPFLYIWSLWSLKHVLSILSKEHPIFAAEI